MGDSRLRDQYEALPYPPRSPKDETKRLIVGSPSHLAELDHYGFGGAIRTRERPIRCLVAGGGTGDASIMLAQQLADAGIEAEIHHVDLSAASCEVVASRAQIRNLTSVQVHHGSFLDLEPGETPPFDYIDCCGVLHHLDDPLAALRHLAQLLKSDGAMGLMVYGQHGRTGLYPLQDALRRLAGHAKSSEAVSVARRLVKQLPDGNWFRRNPFLKDHVSAGDAGVYDLLLCPRDRAFDVIEVSQLVTAAGLRLTAFVEPVAYDPASYISDVKLLDRVVPLTWMRRCAIAECLSGIMSKHVFYCAKATNPIQAPMADDETAIPVPREFDPVAFAGSFRPGQALTARINGLELRRVLPPLTVGLLRHVDGETPIGSIIDRAAAAISGQTRDRLLADWRSLFGILNGVGKLYLRRP